MEYRQFDVEFVEFAQIRPWKTCSGHLRENQHPISSCASIRKIRAPPTNAVLSMRRSSSAPLMALEVSDRPVHRPAEASKLFYKDGSWRLPPVELLGAAVMLFIVSTGEAEELYSRLRNRRKPLLLNDISRP